MKKRIPSLLLAFILICAMAMNSFAADTIDMNKEGSITVKVVDGDIPLKGLTLTCIRVGSLEAVDGNYEFIRVYDNKKLTGEIYSEGLANQLSVFVSDHASNFAFDASQARVDEDGYAVFEACTPGLYLMMQEDTYALNGKTYEKLRPFVVTIPYDGKYDVDTSSKTALNVKPTEQPQDPDTPDNLPDTPDNLPETGQLNWPIPVMAFSGVVLFALGWKMRFGHKKDQYET